MTGNSSWEVDPQAGWDGRGCHKGQLICFTGAMPTRLRVPEGERGGEGRKLKRSQSLMQGGLALLEEEVGAGFTEGILRTRMFNIQL